MRSVPLSPNETHAIVVGIEKYDASEGWNLNGPAHDARGFVDWLISQDVPTDNILFCLSPLDQNNNLANLAGLVVPPATRHNIFDYLLYTFLTASGLSGLSGSFGLSGC